MVKSDLIKTCSICGELKPLAAFLHMNGANGTVYGNICSSCRKAKRDKPKPTNELEDSTTSSTGFKIDAKAKVKTEAVKREQRENKRVADQEAREKIEKKSLNTLLNVDKKTKEEKKHRETFLDKPHFLSEKNKGPSEKWNPASETMRKEQGVDLLNPVSLTDTQIAGKQKYQSVTFQTWAKRVGSKQFSSWLGDPSFVKNAKKAARTTNTPLKESTPEEVREMIKKTRGNK